MAANEANEADEASIAVKTNVVDKAANEADEAN